MPVAIPQFLYHPIVLPTLVAYVISLFGKILYYSWQRKQLTFHRFWRDGGMPSSHTAFVVGLAASIFLAEGQTTAFWVAVAFAMVVMHDAIGVRYEAGRQGKAINAIMRQLRMGGTIKDRHMKEILGHTPNQVMVGGILAILVVTLVHYSIFV